VLRWAKKINLLLPLHFHKWKFRERVSESCNFNNLMPQAALSGESPVGLKERTLKNKYG